MNPIDLSLETAMHLLENNIRIDTHANSMGDRADTQTIRDAILDHASGHDFLNRLAAVLPTECELRVEDAWHVWQDLPLRPRPKLSALRNLVRSVNYIRRGLDGVESCCKPEEALK